MINYIELKKFIKKHCKIYELAKVMNIDRVTLEYKLNGYNPFSVAEIRWFRQYFNLTDAQVISFFKL